MPVTILTSSRFRRLLKKMSSVERAEVDRAVRELSQGFGLPHAHQGLGIRKLVDALFELRVGLDLRVLFWFEHGELTLHFLGTHFLGTHFIGTHDQVRAFLGNQT